MSARTGRRVFRGVRAFTGDPRNPWAASFAVEGGRFVANEGGEASVTDLGGAVVVPGIHDAHLHLSAGALTAGWVNLRGADSPRVAAERVAARARTTARGDWIRGWGWDQTRWSPPVWPSRDDLDPLLDAHPVLLSRVDGHVVWFNGAALERLGWLQRGEGSASLVARGIAAERAAEEASARVPQPSAEERRRALLAALRTANSLGITSVEDIADPWALGIYDALRGEAKLTARVQAWLPFHTPAGEAAELRRAFPSADPWLAAGTLKIFLDGTLGARSAALFDDYSDAPGERGELREDPARLRGGVEEAHRQGWSVALHAIGDRAVAAAIDLLASLEPRAQRQLHRIEHVQLIRRDDIRRMADARIVASVQPIHHCDDRAWIAERLGPRRAAGAYPLRSLHDAGVLLVFGTDWPVAALDPLANIRAATTGRAGEALALETAWSAATRGPALARGADDLGRIAPGYRADFAVLATDPFAPHADPPEGPIQVGATYVDGRRVYPELDEV